MSDFFTFTFQAVAITFVQVTAQIYAKLRKSHLDFFRNWFHISFYTQAASQILLSSSPTSGERRGGDGCSFPAAHQSGRSTISNISGNSWDLSSPILRVIGNFTLQWAQRSAPPFWDRLDRPHCINTEIQKSCGKYYEILE